mgnify:CR=1 FL=1
MGSEMCIRDSPYQHLTPRRVGHGQTRAMVAANTSKGNPCQARTCLLYTSDAADERSSVDLGGRRIIKKKKKHKLRLKDDHILHKQVIKDEQERVSQ